MRGCRAANEQGRVATMNDFSVTRMLLARRVLAGLCDRPREVSEPDRTALLACAKDDAGRAMPLRPLAAIVLDGIHRGMPAQGTWAAERIDEKNLSWHALLVHDIRPDRVPIATAAISPDGIRCSGDVHNLLDAHCRTAGPDAPGNQGVHRKNHEVRSRAFELPEGVCGGCGFRI